MTQQQLILILTSVISAALVDLHAYRKSREAGVAKPFDWTLFSVRVLTGMLVGAGSAFGVSQLPTE